MGVMLFMGGILVGQISLLLVQALFSVGDDEEDWSGYLDGFASECCRSGVKRVLLYRCDKCGRFCDVIEKTGIDKVA